MTAINQDGQVYFVFEELDFKGAIDDVFAEIQLLIKKNEDLIDSMKNLNSDCVEYKNFKAEHVKNTSSINKQYTILNYLQRLRRGQRYV